MGKLPKGLADWMKNRKGGKGKGGKRNSQMMAGGKHMMPNMPPKGIGQGMMMKRSKKNKKFWIAGAIKHPGALRQTAGVKKGQKIPKGTLARLANKPGVTGKRARLAQTLGSFSKVSKGAKAYLKRVGLSKK